MDGRALIRSVMARKNVKLGEMADDLGYKRQSLANLIQYNKMSLERFSEMADYLGCDVVLIDRDTRDIFR